MTGVKGWYSAKKRTQPAIDAVLTNALLVKTNRRKMSERLLAPAGAGPRDDNELTLQVPTDGSVQALKETLDRLDRAAFVVDDVSVHTADLDDVFFALTGHSDTPTITQEGALR